MGAVLELRDLSTHFGGLPALDGLDLDVGEGAITAVIGPNGAGKSTMLRTVAGLHVPTRGRVLLRGAELTGLPVHRVRQHGVALVSQTPRPLRHATVREHVAVGAMFGTPGGRLGEQAALAAAAGALDLVGLAGLAGRPVTGLTLHERRRVDLARAVAGRPRVLLLDEVMAGLTGAEVAEALAVVRRVRDELGASVVWVEHVVRAVRALADHVAVLDHGELLAQGAPDAVLADDRVVEAYLGPEAGTGAA